MNPFRISVFLIILTYTNTFYAYCPQQKFIDALYGADTESLLTLSNSQDPSFFDIFEDIQIENLDINAIDNFSQSHILPQNLESFLEELMIYISKEQSYSEDIA